MLFLGVSVGEDLGKSLSKTSVCDTWCLPSLHLFELRDSMARMVKHWHRLPREVVGASSLEASKVRLNGALSNMI